MSGRLCCYKQQQQNSKLLAHFVLKVSAFRFNTRTKMRPARNKNHPVASKSWVSKHVDKTLPANSVRCKQAWYIESVLP